MSNVNITTVLNENGEQNVTLCDKGWRFKML